MGIDGPSDSEPIACRYTLDDVIGAGATAIVHKGRDLVTNQPVAVKVYRTEGTTRYRLQQRREIAALTRLRHPGLVALHDGGVEPGPSGRIYLVTDLVEGPSLAERLLDGPLDARAVHDLTARLAGALAHVHAGGFVHRDIKPANILLDHDHQAWLADFGIARALDGTIATATGAVAGTAAYLAPEQVRGSPVDPAADVYSLGLVLLEALTGKREYPGTMIESATARLHRRPAVPPGLPWNLTALLEGMTDPDPAGRPTAAAVTDALATAPSIPDPTAAATPRVEPPSTGSSAGSSARARSTGKAPLLVAAAVVLAFLLGGASLLVTTAPSNVPAPSLAGPSPASSPITSGAPARPTIPATAAPTPVAAAAVAAAVPVEQGQPDKVASIAAYTHGGQVSDPDPAPAPAPAPADRVGTDPDTTAAATDVPSATNGKGKGKANGKGNSKGEGEGDGDGGGNGNGNGKKGG